MSNGNPASGKTDQKWGTRYDAERLWGRVASEPVFVLTSDQDWAPEWAIKIFLEKVKKWAVPLHMFRTSPSAALDGAIHSGTIEQGWHPNFLPGSSHGATVDEVVGYCQRMFPGARTMRAHCFAEDTHRMRALARAGIVADSHWGTPCQGYLLPLVHFTGILRLPVYFEDDVAFAAGASQVGAFRKTLFTPGLKILIFHPMFVGCNTPSMKHYSEVRDRVFGSAEPAPGVRWEGRGTANLFDELMDEILSAGYRFTSLHRLVDELLPAVATAEDLLPKQFVGHAQD
jgi:hypothetical protein